MKRLILWGLLASFVVAGAAAYAVFWLPNSFDGDRFVLVSKGENFSQVTDALQKAGILRSAALFQMAGRLRGLTTRMQIGKYRFKSGMSNSEILEDLRSGRTIEAILVTIPEGVTAARQARLLARKIGIDSARFLALVRDSAFARSLGVSAPTLEGYLWPSTYQLYWQSDEGTVIRELVGGCWRFFNDSMLAVLRSRDLSIHEVLTMASIVEGETSIDSERAIVAGVYYNRLKKGMRLEADPTIEYIIPDGPRALRTSDLFRESPYNTYRNSGLPPGPISNPGKASVLAALFPRKSRFLFFVANGEGGHHFSVTYDQHRAAVKRLRSIREFRKLVKEEEEG